MAESKNMKGIVKVYCKGDDETQWTEIGKIDRVKSVLFVPDAEFVLPYIKSPFRITRDDILYHSRFKN